MKITQELLEQLIFETPEVKTYMESFRDDEHAPVPENMREAARARIANAANGMAMIALLQTLVKQDVLLKEKDEYIGKLRQKLYAGQKPEVEPEPREYIPARAKDQWGRNVVGRKAVRVKDVLPRYMKETGLAEDSEEMKAVTKFYGWLREPTNPNR